VLLLLNPSLTLFAFLPLPFVAVMAHVLIQKIGIATGELYRSAGKMNSKTLESGEAAQTIRAFGLEERETAQFELLAADVMARNLRLARLEAAIATVLQVLLSMGVFSLLFFGGRKVLGRELSTGQFVAFLQYMGMMAWPLSGISWGCVLLRKSGESLGRIFEILGTASISDVSGVGPPPPFPGKLEVRGLTFTRPGMSRPCLKDLSFQIEPGERVALVGPVGSGKSTLLDLLTRYLDPPPGTVYLGGRDITQVPLAGLRRHFAVIPEETILFSESIRENIQLGDLRHGVDEMASVEGAAHLACVTQDPYPEGLETRISQGAKSLSGGQGQRVALARGIVRGARILILDNATSALDGATEEAVFENLFKLPGKPTLLFVTHRPERLQGADRILVLDEGTLVESGSHRELIGRMGTYTALVRERPLEEAFDRS
jgi:ATP-binding cassette subfamily B multidrug efflux pump